MLPFYRAPLSQRLFTQPHILPILCLKPYGGRTFREAEVRARGHDELPQVLGLRSVPDLTTLYRFL